MLVIVAAMILIVAAAALTVAVIAYPMQGRQFEPSAHVDAWLVELAERTGATDASSADDRDVEQAFGEDIFAGSSASGSTTRD